GFLPLGGGSVSSGSGSVTSCLVGSGAMSCCSSSGFFLLERFGILLLCRAVASLARAMVHPSEVAMPNNAPTPDQQPVPPSGGDKLFALLIGGTIGLFLGVALAYVYYVTLPH